MSVEENLQVMNKIEEAVNARDWKRFDELHAESVVEYSPQNSEGLKGITAHRESLQNLINAFPDMRGKVTHSFGQGDWVCMEFTFSGTHKRLSGAPVARRFRPRTSPFECLSVARSRSRTARSLRSTRTSTSSG